MGFSNKLLLGFDLPDKCGLVSLNGSGDPYITYFADGTPRDRFSSFTWTIETQDERRLQMCFGTLYSRQRSEIGLTNILVLKRIVLCELFAANPTTLESLRSNWSVLSRICLFCTLNNCAIGQLGQNDEIASRLIDDMENVSVLRLLAISERLCAAFDVVDIILLSPLQISRARRKLAYVSSNQTPCIPTRIHDALMDRCHLIIDEFLGESENFRSLLKAAYRESRIVFNKRTPFPELAKSFPVLSDQVRAYGGQFRCPAELVGHLNLVRRAGFVLVSSYMLTRRGETLSVRNGNLRQEHDRFLGTVYLMSGRTSKTQLNDAALWITSPRIEVPIKAISEIAKIAFDAAGRSLPDDFRLFCSLPNELTGAPESSVERTTATLSQLNCSHFPILSHPDFFITDTDLEEAKRITPSIDLSRFHVGSPWPLASHQIRRTMIVRCAASGVVSPQSLSFQAKHQTEKMTWYYMNNYWELRKGQDLDSNYEKHDQEIVAEEFADEYCRQKNDFVSLTAANVAIFSPFGDEHKQRILKSIPVLSLADVKKGLNLNIIKKTLLGLCCATEHCDYSSSISIRGCMTNSNNGPCVNALVDINSVRHIEAFIAQRRDDLELLTNTRGTEFRRSIIGEEIDQAEHALKLINKRQKSPGFGA